MEREVRNGRKLYGKYLINKSTGERVYVALRKSSEIFLCGCKTHSEAMRNGVAEWALDDLTLKSARLKNVRVVCVKVVNTDDLYATNISNFFDKSLAKIRNYENKNGSLQRYLPLSHFKLKRGELKL